MHKGNSFYLSTFNNKQLWLCYKCLMILSKHLYHSVCSTLFANPVLTAGNGVVTMPWTVSEYRNMQVQIQSLKSRFDLDLRKREVGGEQVWLLKIGVDISIQLQKKSGHQELKQEDVSKETGNSHFSQGGKLGREFYPTKERGMELQVPGTFGTHSPALGAGAQEAADEW